MGIRELKQNPSAVLASVKAGDDVVITERGLPIARIVPTSPSPLEEMLLAGEITPPKRQNLAEIIQSIALIAPDAGSPNIQQRLDWSRGYTNDD